MKHNTFIFLTLLLLTSLVHQGVAQTGAMVTAIEEDGQLYPLAMLPNVTVVDKRSFGSVFEQNKFNRLKHNVMTVHPYAVEAARIYHEINLTLAETNKRRDKKRYLRQLNEQLENQFSDALKDLTTTQGEILIKLISRYTGESVYDIVSEFKNPVSAFFWQNTSRVYGLSLKTKYDPQQDKDIEMIVRSLENTYYQN